MHNRFVEVLGEQVAATLMEHLPPVGWSEVATKRDIDGLATATRHDLEVMRLQFESTVDRRLAEQTRSLFVGMAGMLAAYTGVIVTVLR